MHRIKAFFRINGQAEDARIIDTYRRYESRSNRRRWPLLLQRRPSSNTSADQKRPLLAMVKSMIENLIGSSTEQRKPDPTINTTGKCHLLELPGELRNTIYETVYAGTSVELAASTRTPGLLLACKQTRSEAEPMYWSLTNFKSWKLLEIRDFLIRVGAENLNMIRTITYEEFAASTTSRDDRVHGIAWSAFMAQWKLFFLAKWLRNEGVMLPETLSLQAPFLIASGELAIHEKPWQEFARLLQARSCAAVSGGDGQGVGQIMMTSAERDALRRAVTEQSRFFDYEHLDCSDCWTSEWCVVPGYMCGCPASKVG